jgi:hypothetical protein
LHNAFIRVSGDNVIRRYLEPDMAGKTRSPNYPSIGLGDAIDALRPVYAKERRAKFPRTSLATHLGYTSLNGRALAKIGALRAYGLIDGREDALTISPVAIALLEAPEGSVDRSNAYYVAFRTPTLFQRIEDEHGGEPPSPETLRWWLTQQGFIGEAADRAMRSYLDSRELVNSITGAYKPEPVEPSPRPFGRSLEDELTTLMPFPKAQEGKPPVRHGQADEGIVMGVHERVLQSGLLSKAASYRVIVSGPVGTAELDRLIAKLEMDKEILADPDPVSATGDDPDHFDSLK